MDQPTPLPRICQLCILLRPLRSIILIVLIPLHSLIYALAAGSHNHCPHML
jgi:hypothetical protein